MVWINYEHYNYSVQKGVYGGALCLCRKCAENRLVIAIEKREVLNVEKICVCPECKKVVRWIEPTPAICYRANEILKSNLCSWPEALQMALEEMEDDK